MSSSVPQPLAGKVALITGATKGIGRATALELASLGANVVITYSSDDAAAHSLVQEIGSEKALAVKSNAGSLSDINTLISTTISKFSKIDILIPNAGIMPMRSIENTTEEDWDSCYNINVKGPYFLVQKAVPHMAPGSSIILLSTSLCASSTVTPPYLLYVSTKGSIEQMLRVLAKDLGRKGIRVNGIAPGPTGTELFFKGKSEELVKMIANGNPFGRLGTPEEIAGAMAFLAGSGSGWVNGQVVRVNGGMTVG
ncbi:NAD(P)-binding protein [Amniculicola lignicola CBS 123094]|uniref:NAD(P)-binding protein n=1 Tax=Amniculicola lignicola CBS 123094 TaxID=1392246 RepID=A0A6A5WSJ4_9PLEO|nr:NAD(P)-binding protein [Amniculicola lignicola CBS 123094]